LLVRALKGNEIKLFAAIAPCRVVHITLADDAKNFARAEWTRTVQAGIKTLGIYRAKNRKNLNRRHVGNFWLETIGRT
jgi:hypothetical protein